MEFGKLANVDHIPWELPPTDPLSLAYLKTLSAQKPKYFIGTPAWGHRSWIGKIYPEKTKPQDFLRHYAEHFNCIELNTTHYRIPDEEQTKKWLEQVGESFLFCPKMFQEISHRRNGLLDQELLRIWFQFLERLQGNLGVCFVQLPPHFDLSQKQVLFHFLQNWPKEFELALEFRHPSWFEKGVIRPALVEYLQSKSIGLVMTDVAGRRDVLHGSISAPFTMIRFIGNNLHSSDFSRADMWTEKLKSWNETGLHKVYFMVHEPDDVSAPEMAQYILRHWNANDVAHLKDMQLQAPGEEPQISLF